MSHCDRLPAFWGIGWRQMKIHGYEHMKPANPHRYQIHDLGLNIF